MIGKPVKPFKVENESVERSFEVKDKYIILHEKISHDLFFEPREFISLYREFVKSKEDLKDMLSDEQKKRIEKEMTQIDKDLEKMSPFLEQAEDIIKNEYERQEQESVLNHLKAELKKGREANIEYLKYSKKRLSKENFKKLTKNEQRKLNKLLKA